MHNMLRTLLFTLVTCTGLGVAAQGHLIYVAGHANPCNSAMNGSTVTISAVGAITGIVTTATTTLNDNCYYYLEMMVADTAGMITVAGSCGNGTAATGSGTYYLEPPFTTDVIVDLTCGGVLDCENVAGGTALPGTPCDDGDPETFNDLWTPWCTCFGSPEGECWGFMTETQALDNGVPIPWQVVLSSYSTGVAPFTTTWWVDGEDLGPGGSSIVHTFDSPGAHPWNATTLDATGCSNPVGNADMILGCDGLLNSPNRPGQPCVVPGTTLTGIWSNACVCVADPTEYHVTVQGSVSPCELLDNTVTVRCTSCTPWVETSVPVDANCNYSAVLTVPNMTGTIVVATGCSNGSVPNNTIQYIVNPGQTGTMVTLLLSCAPAPGEACFTVEETSSFTAMFANCSTGCVPPYTYVWDISGPGGGTQQGDVIEYTFPGPGTYAVCLNIAGSDGCVASTCQDVVVDANGAINPSTPGDCEADFWVIQAYQGGGTPGGAPIPGELWIWNLSSGGTGNYQFLWNFGDGMSSTEAFPTHVYAQDGPYVLCLTVYDNSGCTNTYCDSISVDEDGMLQGMIVQGHDPHGTLQGERSEGFTINVLDPLTMGMPEGELSALNTWPNPAQDRLEISLNSIKSGQVRTEVIDANGRRVVGTLSPLVNGQNRITLDVANLPAGMYLLRIGEGSQTVVRRFVKG